MVNNWWVQTDFIVLAFAVCALIIFAFARAYHHQLRAAKPEPQVYGETVLSVATIPASIFQKRDATIAGFFIAMGTILVLPFASHKLIPIAAVFPTTSIIAVFEYALTGILLYERGRSGRNLSSGILGCTFLVSAAMVLTQTLTFPSSFGLTEHFHIRQTPIYMYYFWHLSFPIGVLLYQWSAPYEATRAHVPRRIVALRLLPYLAATIIGALIFTGLNATDHLPSLIGNNTFNLRATLTLVPISCLLSVAAMMIFLSRFDKLTVVECWLNTALFAITLDAILQAFGGGRYSVGWYFARLVQDLSGLLVLSVLINEIGRVDLRLRQMHNLEAETKRGRKTLEELQKAFLPQQLPSFEGINFDVDYIPAEDDALIGGDWYDVFVMPHGKIAVAIGDVAGHGVEAAVAMGEVRQSLRALAFDYADPSEVLQQINRIVSMNPRDKRKMVTAVYGVLDPFELTFTYANAGHPVPISIPNDTGTAPTLFQNGGAPLGVVNEMSLVTRTVKIEPDSLLVFYTDGLIESKRDVIDGLQQLLQTSRDLMEASNPARAIRERLLSDHDAGDDVAILTLRLRLEGKMGLHESYEATLSSSPIVRLDIRRLGEKYGMSPRQIDDMTLAVGEAVNNAIEHSYVGQATGVFTVHSSVANGYLYIDISDHGHWRQKRESGRGRGMMIMREFSTTVDVSTSADGTLARLGFAIPWTYNNGHN